MRTDWTNLERYRYSIARPKAIPATRRTSARRAVGNTSASAPFCTPVDLFWTPEECVMQLHPPAADHINTNAFVLHLWKPLDVAIPMPPKICV